MLICSKTREYAEERGDFRPFWPKLEERDKGGRGGVGRIRLSMEGRNYMQGKARHRLTTTQVPNQGRVQRKGGIPGGSFPRRKNGTLGIKRGGWAFIERAADDCVD